MFGETTSGLILYLAPVESSHLAGYGYSTGVLEDLLDEKASIVYSYLPERYRRLYQARVTRLIVIESAKAGQTQADMPFSSMSNVVGFVNPTGSLEDFYSNNDSIAVTASFPTLKLSFSALSLGDKLAVDFDNLMSDFAVPVLAWATKVLAALDLLGTISSDLESGELLPRVNSDAQRVFAWLEALNSSSPGDRVVVKELEWKFYDGNPTPLVFANAAAKALMGVQDVVS